MVHLWMLWLHNPNQVWKIVSRKPLDMFLTFYAKEWGGIYVLEDRQPSLWGDKFMQQGNSTKGLENNFHYEGNKSFTTCVKSWHNWKHLLYVTDIASFQRFYKYYFQCYLRMSHIAKAIFSLGENSYGIQSLAGVALVNCQLWLITSRIFKKLKK